MDKHAIEMIRHAVEICFSDERNFAVVDFTRNDDDTASEIELAIGADKFYLCLYDEALEGATTRDEVVECLRRFSVADVVKSIPGNVVSVTRSGCIFGPV